MEEKLFWISVVSGAYAFSFKRFLRAPKRLEEGGRVVLLNALFWAFVGVAAGFLVASYKELNTLSWPIGISCALAGGLLGALWVLPTRLKPEGMQLLWAVQGMALTVSLGGLLGVERVGLAMGIAGIGLLGAGAGQLARSASAPIGRASVAGFLAVQGVLAGYWFSSAGGADPSLWMMVLLGAGGYFLGNGWRPRYQWTAETNGVLLRESLEWADTGFSAILLAAAIMYFVVQAFKIPSGSMRSTLLEGDHLFVNKFIYGLRVPYTGKKILRWREVQRGDVVVFRFPAESKESQYYGKDFIKRAIGLPGDTVEIRDKRVFVNGQETVEPYTQFVENFSNPASESLLSDATYFQNLWEHRLTDRAPAGENVRDNFGPVVVPPGNYFVMGDNRDRSFDGRFWGPMPDANLKGRAWLLYLPFRRWKIIR
jgi:signal peptidase I